MADSKKKAPTQAGFGMGEGGKLYLRL